MPGVYAVCHEFGNAFVGPIRTWDECLSHMASIFEQAGYVHIYLRRGEGGLSFVIARYFSNFHNPDDIVAWRDSHDTNCLLSLVATPVSPNPLEGERVKVYGVAKYTFHPLLDNILAGFIKRKKDPLVIISWDEKGVQVINLDECSTTVKELAAYPRPFFIYRYDGSYVSSGVAVL